MANAFDFELVADDKVSDVITRIDDAVRKLVPVLQNTKEELALGGQDTSDGLDGISDRLNGMSRAARDNVQFIGDMVPPLKMVGELSSKLAGVGALGAAGYGIKRVAESFADASREAYNLDVSAKNAGMRVDEFSRLSGAMQILGSDSQSANASIEAMFKTFNDAANGRNAGALSAMVQIGAQIEKNQDGSVNVLKTMESIARVFPSLRPEQQKTAAEALGLDDNGLQLLREGLRLKELLAKSDQFGLTVDPELNNKLADVNSTMNELGASWEGLKAKTKGMIFEGLLSDGSVKDGLEGITDLLSNGDFTGLSHALGLVSSDDAKKLRRIQGDKELYDSLSRRERGAVDGGFYTDAVRKRYDAHYGAADTAEQLQQDLSAIVPNPQGGQEAGYLGRQSDTDVIPYDGKNNGSRGLRNNNPGNIEKAPNAIGKDGRFPIFASSHDGLAAQARQLMLYGDRGQNTISSIIHQYAPKFENNTQAYIDAVSRMTGFKANEKINLHDMKTLKSVMAAMIKHENGSQPFRTEEFNKAISSAVMEDKWSGLRNKTFLQQQRSELSLQRNVNGDSGNDLGGVKATPILLLKPSRQNYLEVQESGYDSAMTPPQHNHSAQRNTIPPLYSSEKTPGFKKDSQGNSEDSNTGNDDKSITDSKMILSNRNLSQGSELSKNEGDKRIIFPESSFGASSNINAEMMKGDNRKLADREDKNPFKLEVVLVNDKTGERRQTTVQEGGRVTVPMRYS